MLDLTKDQPAAAIAADPGAGPDRRHATSIRRGTANPGTSRSTDIEPERDEFEIALVHAAAEAKLPILGICRGMQVLNVALGGTLIQDIGAELPGSLEHSVPAPAPGARARGLDYARKPALEADAGEAGRR